MTLRSIPTRVGNTCDGRVDRTHEARSIPTRVGNTSRGSSSGDLPSVHPHARGAPSWGGLTAPVHPHARGEHASMYSTHHARSGPSPRAWGTRAHLQDRVGAGRSIPTRVGNTSEICPSSVPSFGPSPRAWGTRRVKLSVLAFSRSIPTRVGNTGTGLIDKPLQFGPSPRAWGTRPVDLGGGDGDAVHPHARGEHLPTVSG